MTTSSINKGLICLAFVITVVFLFVYGSRNKAFYGDVLGYYLYLPSTFIYDNLKNPADKLPTDKGIGDNVLGYLKDLNHTNKTPTGNVADSYTYGIALTEAPFFFLAHGWEKARGLPANGYSENYFFAVKCATMLYALLGLLLIFKILRNYFSETISLITAILIFMATNLFWFVTEQVGMSHVPLFFLYSLLIYLVIQLHQRPKFLWFFGAGFSAGLITIIRPTDILCLFIPLLYNVYNKDTINKKILFIRHNYKLVFLFTIAFLLPVIPQLIYWKVLAGSYIYYSYGAGFDFLHPKIIEGLFYFQNGWLPYAPVMIFSLLGLFFFKPIVKWQLCILVILPIYVYVIYSWFCYQYINGLGSRPMIDIYPLLALPLASFLKKVSEQKWIIKFAFSLVCIFLISVNFCFSIQQMKGVLWSEESNGHFNLQMLFRTHLRYDDLVVNDIAEFQPDSTKLTKIYTLAVEHYDDSISEHFVADTIFGSKYIYHMQGDEYSKGISLKCDKKAFIGARWIKCSGKFMYPFRPDYNKHMLVIDIRGILWRGCKIENKIRGRSIDTGKNDIMLGFSEPGRWGYVSYYTRVPENIADGDLISLFVWSPGKKDLYIDDLCLELYK